MLVYIFNILLAACTLYAFVRGGAPEKVVAAAFVAAAIATYVVHPGTVVGFHGIELGILLIDACLFLAVVAVALWANRFWPIWIASFQLFTLLVHAAKAYQADVLPSMYYLVISDIAFPMLIMLAVGTMFHFDRIRRYGSDPDWTPSLH